MMTAEDFRQLACGLPGAEEKGHMGHPDFRVGGKIFATLGYPDTGWAMVKLTPEEQRVYVALDAIVFIPRKRRMGLARLHERSAAGRQRGGSSGSAGERLAHGAGEEEAGVKTRLQEKLKADLTQSNLLEVLNLMGKLVGYSYG